MNDRDYLAELGSAVASYLLTLSAVAECAENACPDVGGPYRQRLNRLRSRLSFEATRESIAASAKTVEAELRDYAKTVQRHQSQHELELRSAILLLQEMIESMALHAEFQGSELERLADQMETGAQSQYAARLRDSAEKMTGEALRITAKMREEIQSVESRLEGARSVDPTTGLLNRAEMIRQIEAFRMTGCEFTTLRFELHGAIGERVLRQAAERLNQSFRHRERIGRWSETGFMVLFQGPREIAEKRANEVAPQLQHYSLDAGTRVEATVKLEIAEPELAVA